MTITVICDNEPYKEGLETDWGFSCLITGLEKNILFDTGPGRLLLDNMEKLEIEPKTIDIVFLSHIHGDHSGGLNSFLERNPDVSVYLPKSFPKEFKNKVHSSGAEVVEVEQSVKICKDVYSTGQVKGWIKEQSLIMRTDKGQLMITGCAHPGIVKIVTTAKKLMNDDILLLMGGFHLELATKGKIERIISFFKQMGVRNIAAAHCTGEKAVALFEKHYGENYVRVGAGKVIEMEDLQ